MTYVRRRPKHLILQDRIHYLCELDTSPACGTRLVTCRHYRWAKPVQLLDRVVYVTNRPKRCPYPACAAAPTTYGKAAAQAVALPNSSYGLDVIAQLGWWRDHEQLSGAQLHARLHGRVQISRRSVNLLLTQYRLLLASAEHLKRPALAAAVQTHGGLSLSLDGLEPEGAQEQLWVVREVLTDTTLLVGWLPRVTQATLQELVAPVVELLTTNQWPLLATVSDKQQVVELALTRLWPQVPHQWCQAHYLRQMAEPIVAHDHAFQVDLRRDVRQALRPSLRQVATSADDGAFSPCAGQWAGRSAGEHS
jgi:hypothetical protein